MQADVTCTGRCTIISLRPLSTICVRGGKINDITERLLQLPKDTKFENVILQVGSTDCCCAEFGSDIFLGEITQLLLPLPVLFVIL